MVEHAWLLLGVGSHSYICQRSCMSAPIDSELILHCISLLHIWRASLKFLHWSLWPKLKILFVSLLKENYRKLSSCGTYSKIWNAWWVSLKVNLCEPFWLFMAAGAAISPNRQRFEINCTLVADWGLELLCSSIAAQCCDGGQRLSLYMYSFCAKH